MEGVACNLSDYVGLKGKAKRMKDPIKESRCTEEGREIKRGTEMSV